MRLRYDKCVDVYVDDDDDDDNDDDDGGVGRCSSVSSSDGDSDNGMRAEYDWCDNRICCDKLSPTHNNIPHLPTHPHIGEEKKKKETKTN